MNETPIIGSVTGVELLSKKRLCAVIDLIREASKLGVKRFEMGGIKLVFQPQVEDYRYSQLPVDISNDTLPSDDDLLMNPYAGLEKGKV